MKVTRRQLRQHLRKILLESNPGQSIIPSSVADLGTTKVLDLYDASSGTISTPDLVNALVNGVKTGEGQKLGIVGEDLAITLSMIQEYFGDGVIKSANTNQWQNPEVMGNEFGVPTGAGDSFGVDIWASKKTGDCSNDLREVVKTGNILDISDVGVAISMKLSITTAAGGLKKQSPSFKTVAGMKKMSLYLALEWLIANSKVDEMPGIMGANTWEDAVTDKLTALGITTFKYSLDAINGSFNPLSVIGSNEPTTETGITKTLTVDELATIGRTVSDNFFISGNESQLRYKLTQSGNANALSPVKDQSQEVISITINKDDLADLFNAKLTRSEPHTAASLDQFFDGLADITLSGNTLSGPRRKLHLLGYMLNVLNNSNANQIATFTLNIPAAFGTKKINVNQRLQSVAYQTFTSTFNDAISYDIFNKFSYDIGAITPEFVLLKMSANNQPFGITITYDVASEVVTEPTEAVSGLSSANYKLPPAVVLRLPPIDVIDLPIMRLLDTPSSKLAAKLKQAKADLDGTTFPQWFTDMMGSVTNVMRDSSYRLLQIEKSDDLTYAIDESVKAAQDVSKAAAAYIATAPASSNPLLAAIAANNNATAAAEKQKEIIKTWKDTLSAFFLRIQEAPSTSGTQLSKIQKHFIEIIKSNNTVIQNQYTQFIKEINKIIKKIKAQQQPANVVDNPVAITEIQTIINTLNKIKVDLSVFPHGTLKTGYEQIISGHIDLFTKLQDIKVTSNATEYLARLNENMELESKILNTKMPLVTMFHKIAIHSVIGIISMSTGFVTKSPDLIESFADSLNQINQALLGSINFMQNINTGKITQLPQPSKLEPRTIQALNSQQSQISIGNVAADSRIYENILKELLKYTK